MDNGDMAAGVATLMLGAAIAGGITLIAGAIAEHIRTSQEIRIITPQGTTIQSIRRPQFPPKRERILELQAPEY